MSETIIAEWNFWIASIITGAGMAFVYDILRLFRSLVHHSRIFVDIEDLIYWIICFLTAFTLLYYGNNGVIRLVAVLGAAIGMLIYAATIGHIFVKYLSFLIKKIISIVSKPILYIIHKIKSKIAKFLLFIKIRLTKKVNKHTININYASEKELKSGKGETKKYEKNKKKKNTRVSPHEK